MSSPYDVEAEGAAARLGAARLAGVILRASNPNSGYNRSR
jgi:hypothetical protein